MGTIPTKEASEGVQVLYLAAWMESGWSAPFPVRCFGVPANWNGSGSITAQLMVGTGAFPSGILEDANGNPIPDNYTFTAMLFVEDNYIYDILGISSYANNANGGIMYWPYNGGRPQQVIFPGGIYTPNSVTTNGLEVNGVNFFTYGANPNGAISSLAEGDILLGTAGVWKAHNAFSDSSWVPVATGPGSLVSGSDAQALGDSGLAYSSDQTVVASTNATGLGIGYAQYSVIVAEGQTGPGGSAYLNTCLGPWILGLLDQTGAPTWNRTIRVHITLMARRIDTPGTDSAWQGDGVLRGNGTNGYTWLGGSPPTMTVIAQDSAAAPWSIVFYLVDAGATYLQAEVTGDSESTINWECTLTLDEVAG